MRQGVRDHEEQSRAATRLLKQAEHIATSVTSLCEFVSVLRRVYRFGQKDILAALDALLDVEKVSIDRPAVDAGLAALRAGGDFADGIIAHERRRLGGETFVSFDRKAVAAFGKHRQRARLLL